MRLSTCSVSRRVQFYETDAAGIVHFSWFPRYLEEAEYALWRAVGLSIAPADGSHGFPRVAIACEYRSPLKFEDEFTTTIRIVAMSERSMRYEGVVSRAEAVVANLSMTIVCVTKGTDGSLRAVELPADVRARLEVATDAVA